MTFKEAQYITGSKKRAKKVTTHLRKDAIRITIWFKRGSKVFIVPHPPDIKQALHRFPNIKKLSYHKDYVVIDGVKYVRKNYRWDRSKPMLYSKEGLGYRVHNMFYSSGERVNGGRYTSSLAGLESDYQREMYRQYQSYFPNNGILEYLIGTGVTTHLGTTENISSNDFTWEIQA